MKVKMLSDTDSSPVGAYEFGDIKEVPDNYGKNLIELGMAQVSRAIPQPKRIKKSIINETPEKILNKENDNG